MSFFERFFGGERAPKRNWTEMLHEAHGMADRGNFGDAIDLVTKTAKMVENTTLQMIQELNSRGSGSGEA